VDISGAVTVNSILFGSTGWIVADALADGTFTLVGEGRITTSGIATATGGTILESIAGGNLIKAGDSILVLNAANSYTGTTTVEKGTLQLNNAAALGATSGVTVNSGGSVSLNGVTVSGVSVTINGSGSGDNFGALKATGSGTSVWAGNVILGSGGTRVGAALGDSVLEISGVISGSQALNVRTNDLGGVVLLTNAGNTYTGDTVVIGGILKVGVDNALPTGTKVVLGNAQGAGSATLDLNGFNQRVAGVTAAASNNVPAKVTNTSATGAVLTVDYSGGTATVTSTASIAGNLSLVKAGTGTFTLQSANTYTGTTTVQQGTLQLDHAGALGGTSGVTVTGGSLALNNVTVPGVSISITSTDSFGGLKSVGSGTSVWTGNVFIGNASARVGANAGTVLEIAGAISGVANSGLTVRTDNTGGTVLLSNANNTYTGVTSVIAGVLKVGVVDALPTDTTVTLGNAASQGFATFDLNGFDQRVAGVTAGTTNNVVAMVTNTSGTASVLTVDSAATLATNSAFITGNLSLVKDGAGIFRLTSANTYTGSTTVNTGTLEISGVLGSVSGQQFILNGGTLLINNSTTGTNNNNRISDTATITFRDGDLTFTGSADASTNSSETVGNLVLDRGYQTVRIAYGGTNAATLTASGFTRSAGGGVVFLSGANLGASSATTTSVSRFFVNTAPTLIGTTDALNTGVNSAVKNTKIVPYLVGSSTGSTTTPDTFVTYNSQTGFRPLDPNSEFTQNLIDATTVGHNTRITSSLTMGASTNVAINSLIVVDPIASTGGANDTTLNLNGNTVTVTSGAILFDSNTSTISGGTLAFGSQEAIIYAHGSTSTISSRITGSGGLTVAGTGTFVLNATNSIYSGDTTLLSATTVIGASSTGSPGAVTQGPLGTGNLVFAGGAVRTTQGAGTRTVGNNIIFKADTTLSSGGAAAGLLVFSGSMTLTGGDRVLTNNAPNTTTFSGAIGEDGQKRGITVTTATAGTGAVIFSGTNTYTGDTKVAGLATLMVNGTHNTGSSYNVASGATLTGGGTIGVTAGGNVTIAGGGTLSVGDGTANAVDLAITTTGGGTLVFADSSSILRLDLVSDSSPGAGNGSDMSGDATRADRLVVSGNTNLNGAHLILGTSGVSSLTFSEGDRWKIFDWVTAIPTGSFTINPATDLPTLGVGLQWDFSDLYTGGTIAVTVVPEPSRAMLLMGGLMVGLLQRRRRRK
jgi:autotransporter-associated beta strand protein